MMASITKLQRTVCSYKSLICRTSRPYRVMQQYTPGLTHNRSTVTTSSIDSSQHTMHNNNAVSPSDGENKPQPDFNNAKAAYSNKSTLDLIRAFVIFKLCSLDTLINNQTKILSITRRLLGERLYRMVLKFSIYGQFMAGESRDEILQSAQAHLDHKVMPMFAYTAVEVHGDVENKQMNMSELYRCNYKAIKESLEHAANIRDLTGVHTKATGKVTFLISPQTLRTFTSMINNNKSWLSQTNRSELHHKLEDVYKPMQEISAVYRLPAPNDEALQNADVESLTTSLCFNLATAQISQGLQLATDEESQLKQLVTWYHDVFQRASDLEVCLVNDAEQSYLQDAMDIITLDFMRVYNKHRPVVHNTYQCYLKRTRDLIRHHLQISETEGFSLGAKIVRGAYMEEERALANAEDRDDPVNPTYDATTIMYHRVVDDLLTYIKDCEENKLQVTFATHNEDTVKYVIQKANAIKLNLRHNVVSFAQLMGMRDHIAFPLGSAGYPSSKLLHYGPIEQGVAYMSRRLQENRAIMPTANTERNLMKDELKNRLFRR